MKVLVTGATGFIGSALIPELVERGHSVIALTRSTKPGDDSKSVNWITGDLDRKSASRISTFTPDACIHSAWIATPGEYLESPENEALVSKSFQFLRELAENGMKHITALGSCIEYDLTTPGPYTETESTIDPQSPYARAKVRLHQLLDAELGRFASICWARIFFPYGCGEHPNRLPSWLTRQILDGLNPQLKTPADRNDYLHIADVARALVIATEKYYNGPLNIGSGKGVVISDILNLIANTLGRTNLPASAAQEPPVKSIIADIAKLRSLGWHAQITIDEGINRLINSISSKSNAK